MGKLGEMAYEQFPRVDVPVIRDWFSPAFDGLNRALWGGRGIFVWGIFFWIYAAWCFVKLVLWVTGIVVITTLFAITAAVDLVTYKHRQERATQAAWTDYTLSLHEYGSSETR